MKDNIVFIEILSDTRNHKNGDIFFQKMKENSISIISMTMPKMKLMTQSFSKALYEYHQLSMNRCALVIESGHRMIK